MDYQKVTKNAYDQVADQYSERDSLIIDETFVVKNALDKFISCLRKGAQVLDVGCAGGRDSRYLAKSGLDVTGIDLSEQMIRNAEAKTEKQAIKYLVMDFERLNFPEKYFDGVWANASLHHVPKSNLLAVLKKINLVLTDDGVFFMIIKCGASEGFVEINKFGTSLKRYFSFYQPDELAKIVELAGFTVLDTHTETSGEWVHLLAKKKPARP